MAGLKRLFQLDPQAFVFAAMKFDIGVFQRGAFGAGKFAGNQFANVRLRGNLLLDSRINVNRSKQALKLQKPQPSIESGCGFLFPKGI